MSFAAFFEAIESEELRVIARQWDAARGARLMPAWRDIDAVGIGRSLRYVWAWKHDADSDVFTGRLAGEEIDRAFGKSLRGKVMSEFYAPDVYRVVFPRHRKVVVERGCMHARGMIFAQMGKTVVGERIAMPLSEDGVKGDGIIGGTFYRPSTLEQGRPLGPDFKPEQAVFFPLVDA